MAKSNRQKYNFLAAWSNQVHEACDAEDALYDDVQQQVRAMASGHGEDERRYVELEDRIRKCEQWLAQHESALEELDDYGSEGVGQEPESYDDGDDDDDPERDEPPMGGERQPDGRLAAPLDGASGGAGARRPWATMTVKRGSRG